MERMHRIQAERELDFHNSVYGNIDFILGSAAEVERLWSLAKHILEDDRRGMMSEDMFEALLFLKVNRRFWNEQNVAEADMTRFELRGGQANDNNDDQGNDQDDEIDSGDEE